MTVWHEAAKATWVVMLFPSMLLGLWTGYRSSLASINWGWGNGVTHVG